MAFHYKLTWLKLNYPALLVHNVVKSLVTELLHKIELLKSPYLDLSFSYLGSSPYDIIENLLIDFEQNTLATRNDVEDLSQLAHASIKSVVAYYHSWNVLSDILVLQRIFLMIS
jgi:hypothetical protein